MTQPQNAGLYDLIWSNSRTVGEGNSKLHLERLVRLLAGDADIISHNLAAHLVSGARCIDVCCGPGTMSKYLFALGAATVVGLDGSSEGLRFAAERISSSNFVPIVSDVDALSSLFLERSFKVAILRDTLMHVDNPRKVFEDCCRISNEFRLSFFARPAYPQPALDKAREVFKSVPNDTTSRVCSAIALSTLPINEVTKLLDESIRRGIDTLLQEYGENTLRRIMVLESLKTTHVRTFDYDEVASWIPRTHSHSWHIDLPDQHILAVSRILQ